MNKLILLGFVLCAIIVCIYADDDKDLSLQEVFSRANKKNGGMPKPRRPGSDCKIRKKPENQCISLKPLDPPLCIADECKFTPKYGEEIVYLWQLFDMPHKYGTEKKYRKILDLGEDLTKSFDAEVCQAENRICHCEDTCHCRREKVVRVCKQKYIYKYERYYVYNTHFCRPKPFNPMQYFYQNLGQGQGYNPTLSYMMNQQNNNQNNIADRRNGRYPMGTFARSSSNAMPPFFNYNNPQLMQKFYGMGGAQNPGMPAMPRMTGYNPYFPQQQQSPSSLSYMFYIMSMANQKQAEQDLDSYVQCPKDRKSTGSVPATPNFFNHNFYNLNMQMRVKNVWLKIKVPSGCECKELKNYDKNADN
ncbi:uncharacterized protein LOC120334017 [Styela clava]